MNYLKKRWAGLGASSALETLQLFLISLFCLECVIGGSGRIISFGYFSLRIILFMVCFFLTLPAVWRARTQLLHQTYTWIWAAFFLLLALYAVRGLRSGYPFSFVKQDVTIFLTLLLYPAFVICLNTRARVQWIVDVLYGGAILVAVVTLGLHVALAFASKAELTAINNFLNHTSYGGLALLGTSYYRIYLKSQMFLQVAILLGLHKIIAATSRRSKVFFLICEVVLVYATILSYTRGFWLGLAISCIILLLCCLRNWKKYLTTLAISLAGVACMFVISYCLYGSNVAFHTFTARVTGTAIDCLVDGSDNAIANPGNANGNKPSAGLSATQELIAKNSIAAQNLREATMEEHERLIAADPFWGYGLGKNLDGIRTDGRTEYTYLDLYMKLGLIGFLLFALVFCWHCTDALKLCFRRKKGVKGDVELVSTYLMAGYVGILVTSYLNPFLTSPMGIMLLLTLIISVKQDRLNRLPSAPIADCQ
ncbi:MAG: O-antigen ligase family protein [Oscillospiraceae bacterium]|nr:O-antigen ligase family protein [Oscillospiraceae bacterium]